MSTLKLLGILSMVFVVIFTWISVMRSTSTRRAIIEAWSNLSIGFAINFAANLAILPLIGTHVSASDNWWMGWIYTSISVVRSFGLRLFFAHKFSKQG